MKLTRTIRELLIFGWCILGVFAAARAQSGGTAIDAETPAAAKSDAERIIDLKQSIQEAEEQRARLRQKLDDPQSERAQAEAQFTELDKELNARKEALQQAQDAHNAEQVQTLQEQVDQVEQRRQLARERFDLALQEQSALKDQIQALERRLAQDQAALAALQSPAPAATAAPTPASPAATAAPAPADDGEKPKPLMPPMVPAPGATTTPSPADSGTNAKAPLSAESAAARKAADAKQAAADEAQAALAALQGRVETLKAQIASEQKLLATAEEKARLAQEQAKTLQGQIRTQSQAGTADDVAALRGELSAAQTRATEARTDARERTQTLAELERDLGALEREVRSARRHAEARQEEAESASEAVARLENPFNPRNIVQWLIDHGPKLLGIILGAFVLIWVTKIFERRLVKFLIGRRDHGSRVERENRANTLASVFRNVAFLVVIVGAILMVLTEIGVQIGPLLGGVAVIGLAVAFGAQSLVKDYFYGFIILMENQYTVNDVIKIGDTAGLVERITLRMTVLRDLEGTAHFVPHGEATRVSNLTHGWSRAVVDVGVSYNENAEHVMAVLTEIGKDFYADAQYRELMLGEPEILGLDALGDSSIVIKMMVKTRPLQQWTIKRQLLLRIKRRFDEVGIEIPYPHRTVYHRFEEGQRLSVLTEEPQAALGNGDGRRDADRRG